MVGKQDVNKDDYYFTTTHVPALIDLNRAVIHFYPDEEANGPGFGGELVVRHYDPHMKASAVQKSYRRRRRKTSSDDATEPEDQNSEVLEEEDE